MPGRVGRAREARQADGVAVMASARAPACPRSHSRICGAKQNIERTSRGTTASAKMPRKKAPHDVHAGARTTSSPGAKITKLHGTLPAVAGTIPGNSHTGRQSCRKFTSTPWRAARPSRRRR